MSKIMLFGSSSITKVNGVVLTYISEWLAQGHNFMLGGGHTLDQALNHQFSKLGAHERVEVYKVDGKGENKFGLPEKKFNTSIDIENKVAQVVDEATGNVVHQIDGVETIEQLGESRKYYQAVDRIMAKECDAALCIWDGTSKNENDIINLLNILGKPCYVLTETV